MTKDWNRLDMFGLEAAAKQGYLQYLGAVRPASDPPVSFVGIVHAHRLTANIGHKTPSYATSINSFNARSYLNGNVQLACVQPRLTS